MRNVWYGNLERGESNATEAAEKANVHEAILSLSEGYRTKVGKRGLMGGKQRLAVAKDPSILFFDEALSVRRM
jgi:ATP-binding cassette subfamily B (MDR/TAP) protein 7